MRVGDIAVGRSGDKGEMLDLTVVARTDADYDRLERLLTAEVAGAALARAMPGTTTRYAVPKLRALKFVVAGALPGGIYASMHAGLHWQKSAIAILLDMSLEEAEF